ncbi:MAG: hypothetical protein U0166_21375 [Acidobacteriota bacterium]
MIARVRVRSLFLPALCLLANVPAFAGEASEGKQRKQDVEAQAAVLRARIAKPADNIVALRKTIARIGSPTNPRQCANPTGFFFRPGEDTVALVNDRMFVGTRNARDTLIAFRDVLKKRGTDLIVLPVPNAQMVYAHRLFPGMPADRDTWPAYTKGLLELCDHDVEVLDVLDAFRAHDGEEPLMMRYDNHWATTGREIAASLLAARLKRYAFGNRADPGRFTVEDVRDTDYDTNFWPICACVRKAHPKNRRLDFVPFGAPPFEIEHLVVEHDPGPAPEDPPVLVIGDSMAGFRTSYPRGSGLANHLSRALGFRVPFVWRKAGARFAPVRYLKSHPPGTTQPRVVVLVVSAGSLAAGEWPFPAPEGIDGTAPEDEPIEITRAEVEITKTWERFDPATAPYDMALAVNQARILSGPFRGRTIALVAYVMKGRKMLGDPIARGSVGARPSRCARWTRPCRRTRCSESR